MRNGGAAASNKEAAGGFRSRLLAVDGLLVNVYCLITY